MNRAFWKDRSVFLTGHTGFKGSWAAFWLNQMGAKVTGYARDPSPEQWLFAELRINNLIDDCRGDINDRSVLEKAVNSADPEIVIHMAAQAIVRESYVDPIDTYMTNVLGTANLLDVLRGQKSVQTILVVTSDKCYENEESHVSFVETDVLGGRDPYSSSKACSELVTRSFRDSFFNSKGNTVGISTARAGNVIGGGDGAIDRLIPDAVRAFSTGKSLAVRNPKAIRPWQHVLDPLAGYFTLCEKLFSKPTVFSGAWNFGPNLRNMLMVKEVLNLAASHFNKSMKIDYIDSEKEPYESPVLCLDSSKAKNLLGWVPRWNIETAIRNTALWYMWHLEGRNMVEETECQIEQFEADLSS